MNADPGPVSSWRRARDTPDPADEDLFPVLDPELVDTIRSYGESRSFAPGEVVYGQGETDVPFYFVETGRVVFFDRNDDDEVSTYFAEVRPGMFAGDVGMLSGEATTSEARAAEPTETVWMERETLQKMVAENAEVGDVILRTMVARREWLRGHGYGELKILGSRWSQETFEIRDFLSRNGVAFEWADVEGDRDARRILDGLGVTPAGTPVVVTPRRVFRRPSVEELAEALGLRPELEQDFWDVVIIGAGPAGLASAVYASSEGLQTLLVEADSPGGQAGASSKIENYLGFPTGLSGTELTERAMLQARKFGAVVSSPLEASGVDCGARSARVSLSDGSTVGARAVIVATGAEYRRLSCDGADSFEGRGLYYGASHTEAAHCAEEDVVVVGGGNSAGQAAIHLTQYARTVRIVVRGAGLEESMSRYLIDRLERDPKIEVIRNAEVVGVDGGEKVERVNCADQDSGDAIVVEANSVFVMIGAEPRTEWLSGCVGMDEEGFIVTGNEARAHPEFKDHWWPRRDPHHLETTRPSVFAAGDCRSGSVKRVASAVGEGAMAIAFAHKVLSRR